MLFMPMDHLDILILEQLRGLKKDALLIQALELTQQHCSKVRFEHVLQVVNVTAKLAQHYGADLTVSVLAAALHDLAKELNPDKLRLLGVSEAQCEATLFDQHPKVWHAFVGPSLAQKYLTIQDERVWDAMRYHTTGRSHMSLEEKIVFVADFIEPTRDHSNQEELEALATQNLDKAVVYITTQTIQKCDKLKQTIHPNSFDCYHYYKPLINL